jgi:tRNA (adenine37-N6)-methyltransferase
MENKYQIKPIGFVKATNHVFSIQLEKEYLSALTNIEGFSHLQIVWWGHLYDTPENRANFTCIKPYKIGPDTIGVFATRSPVRPNPVLITTIYVQQIDYEKGIIYTPYIDAEQGTPVLDIKPYHLSERIRDCMVPQWCKHWPEWYEDSASFNWQNEFNF